MTNKCLTAICLSLFGADRLPRRLHTNALDHLINEFEGRPNRRAPAWAVGNPSVTYNSAVNEQIKRIMHIKMPNREENRERMKRRLSKRFVSRIENVVADQNQNQWNSNPFAVDIWEDNLSNDSLPFYQQQNSLLPNNPLFFPQFTLQNQMYNLQNIANTVIGPPMNPMFHPRPPNNGYRRGHYGARGRGGHRFEPYSYAFGNFRHS